MPRIPRSHLASLTQYFHVICRANNGGALFDDLEDYESLYASFLCYKERWPFDIYHHIFMTTHIHLLVYTTDFTCISRALQHIQTNYCRHFQKKYALVGHLWHSRFRSIPILSTNHLLRCGRYIEMNAVAAGMVQEPAAYRWSSYPFYVNGKVDEIVTVNPYYYELGISDTERRNTYKAFIDEVATTTLAQEMVLFEPKGKPGPK